MKRNLHRFGLTVLLAGLCLLPTLPCRAGYGEAVGEVHLFVEFTQNINVDFTFHEMSQLDPFSSGTGIHEEDGGAEASHDGLVYSQSVFATAYATSPPDSTSVSVAALKPGAFVTISNLSSVAQVVPMVISVDPYAKAAQDCGLARFTLAFGLSVDALGSQPIFALKKSLEVPPGSIVEYGIPGIIRFNLALPAESSRSLYVSSAEIIAEAEAYSCPEPASAVLAGIVCSGYWFWEKGYSRRNPFRKRGTQRQL